MRFTLLTAKGSVVLGLVDYLGRQGEFELFKNPYFIAFIARKKRLMGRNFSVDADRVHK